MGLSGSIGTSPWLQVAAQATHIRLFLYPCVSSSSSLHSAQTASLSLPDIHHILFPHSGFLCREPIWWGGPLHIFSLGGQALSPIFKCDPVIFLYCLQGTGNPGSHIFLGSWRCIIDTCLVSQIYVTIRSVMFPDTFCLGLLSICVCTFVVKFKKRDSKS